MEVASMESDKQALIASFLEIAAGQTPEIALQFLQATSWKLEEALQLFYIGSEGIISAPSLHTPVAEDAIPADESFVAQSDYDDVRSPIPVVRETLYDDAAIYGAARMSYPQREANSVIAFRNFSEESKRSGVWETEDGASSEAEKPKDLAALYRPPFHLMFQGSFDKAKSAASLQEKWLLVNLQSTTEFSSHMLNRDTWANEAVSQTISTNFIFWQVYEDTSEGRKVCTYYKLESIPVILVIDPITGQKMKAWLGMIHPESLLENLVPFMDGGPRDHLVTLSHKRPRGNSSSSTKIRVTEEHKAEKQLPIQTEETTSEKEVPTYPTLPGEPVCEKSLLCRIGVRLPDGRRAQRSFLKNDPIQLIWSFCVAELGEEGKRPFRLMQAIPGAKSLDYNCKSTILDSGLVNSMISVVWDST